MRRQGSAGRPRASARRSGTGRGRPLRRSSSPLRIRRRARGEPIPVKPSRIVLGLVVLPLAGAGLVTAGLVLASHRPVATGLVEGRLRPCPDRPNCVSSQAERDRHAVEPLRFEGAPDAAFAALLALVEDEPRAVVESVDATYAQCVWRTPLLGFRDDVELLLDAAAGAIHVRSASRVGHSDLGANRRRVDGLRARLAERLAAGR